MIVKKVKARSHGLTGESMRDHGLAGSSPGTDSSQARRAFASKEIGLKERCNSG